MGGLRRMIFDNLVENNVALGTLRAAGGSGKGADFHVMSAKEMTYNICQKLRKLLSNLLSVSQV
jgi:hypothetical protein